jgi:hypothetical protein
VKEPEIVRTCIDAPPIVLGRSPTSRALARRRGASYPADP